MRSIYLALSFIRVPKLFASLLFWPLLLGIGITVVQLSVTFAILQARQEFSSVVDKKTGTEEESDEIKWFRELLYGSKEPLPTVTVCRWSSDGISEFPISKACTLNRYDLVIQTSKPEEFDESNYVQSFNGVVHRIHICKTCSSDLLIDTRSDNQSFHINSLNAFSAVLLYEFEADKAHRRQKDEITIREDAYALLGNIILSMPGLKKNINVSQIDQSMVLVINVSCLVIIALWLTLKAHGKVLQYFARNNALLPLVAACGKNTFYNALWVITVIRVFSFLLASIPGLYFAISFFPDLFKDSELFKYKDSIILWIIGLSSSMAATALLTSIAELKHRDAFQSVLYRYAPLFLALFGTCLWAITLLSPAQPSQILQNLISVLPIIGLSPLILSPIVHLSNATLITHTAVSLLLIYILLLTNSRWFAGHLEEI